jgi:hypothetical protein
LQLPHPQRHSAKVFSLYQRRETEKRALQSWPSGPNNIETDGGGGGSGVTENFS